MKRNINNSVLTRDFILSKISQVSIFSRYTGVSVEDIQHCIDTGECISSPFREDNHPSFGFRYDNRNKLKGKDFAGYFHGDCFDAVAYVLSEITKSNIDVNTNRGFMGVLKHISYTFRHIVYGKEKDTIIDTYICEALTTIKHRKQQIEFIPREWTKKDIEEWQQFKIPLKYLNTEFIYPVETYYINRKSNPISKYSFDPRRNDPCYAYILGVDKQGIYNIKLYFPKRGKNEARFITNCNHIEGIVTFPRDDYDIIVITKSTKDRLSIKAYADEVDISELFYGGQNKVNVGVLNIPSESYMLKPDEYSYIMSKSRTGDIISLMDNDRAGIRMAVKLKNEYGIPPFLIPKDYEVKDFAELRQSYSTEIVNMLTKEVINYIIENNEGDKPFGDTEKSDTLPY